MLVNRAYAISVLFVLCFPLWTTEGRGETNKNTEKSSLFEWPGRFKTLVDSLSEESSEKKMEALKLLQAYPLEKLEGPLLKVIDDKDWSVRKNAADILVRKGSKRVVKELIFWLNDFETSHRVAAIELLSRTKNKQAVIPITRALRDFEPEVRIAALEALGRMKAKEALTAITARLDDESVKVRIAAVKVLEAIPHTRTVISLMGKLSDPANKVRKMVIETLGKLGDPRSTPTVLRALKDPAEEIRQAAARALGNLAYTEGVPALIELLNNSSSVAVQRASAAALAQIGTKEAAAALVKTLVNPQKRSIATANIKILGKTAVPSLISRLKHTNLQPAEVRAIVSILASIGDHRASKVLIAELGRQRIDDTSIVEALATCSDSSALIPLMKYFDKTKSDELKLRILTALEPLIDERATAPMIKKLSIDNVTLRTKIVRILGRLKAKKAVPKIIGFLDNENANLQAASLRALGLIGDPKAEKAIEPFLSSVNQTIRLEAADAMGRVANPKNAARFMKRLENETTWTAKTRAAYLRTIGTLLRREPNRVVLAKLGKWAGSQPHDLSLPAIEAIQAARSRDSATVLWNLLKDRNISKEKKIKIVSILGDTYSKKFLPLLLEFLRNDDVMIASAAAWSLGKLGDVSALPHLVSAWKTAEHPALQINIAASVGRLEESQKPKGTKSLLWKMLSHSEPFVQLNATLALSRLYKGKRSEKFFRSLTEVGKEAAHNSHLAQHVLGILQKHKAPSIYLAQAKRSVTTSHTAKRERKWRHLHEKHKFDWIALELTNRHDAPESGGGFILVLGDGLSRAGFTDPMGRIREEGIPQGDCHIILPKSWPKP